MKRKKLIFVNLLILLLMILGFFIFQFISTKLYYNSLSESKYDKFPVSDKLTFTVTKGDALSDTDTLEYEVENHTDEALFATDTFLEIQHNGIWCTIPGAPGLKEIADCYEASKRSSGIYPLKGYIMKKGHYRICVSFFDSEENNILGVGEFDF